jgi:hypothetical protein
MTLTFNKCLMVWFSDTNAIKSIEQTVIEVETPFHLA